MLFSYCTNLQREIKVCEKCFLCQSLVFCKYCTKCQTCCSKSTCRGMTSKFLANLVGSGCQSESCSNPERGLSPPLSDSAKTHTFCHCHKPLCQSPQEQLPVGGITSAYRQERSGTSTKSKISGLFQPTIFSPKTKQQVEAYTRSEQYKSLPQGGEIKNGDTGNHQDFPPTRGVGDLNRLQGRLLSYPNTGTVQKISEISCRGSNLPVQSSALWSVHSTYGVHCGSKGGETDGHTQGYKNPPVPRRLVGESQIPPNLSPAYPNSSENVSRPSLAGKCREIRAGAQTSLQFCRQPVRPQVQSGLTNTGTVAEPSGENNNNNTQVPAPTLTMVAGGEHCAPRSTITPNKTCSASLYRLIKRRVGRSLKRTHCKRVLVSARKQAAYKLSGTKSSLPGSERVPRPLFKPDSTGGNRQHHSSVIHKQGRRHEVRSTMCPPVENLDLVYQQTSNSKGLTHSRPAECGSRQTIQARPDHPDRMVLSSRGLPNNMQQVAPASNRPICHEVQQQAAPVCFTSTGSPGHSSGRTQSTMGGSGRIRLPTSSHIGQSGGEVAGLPMQKNHSDCPGVAEHALVLGPGDHVHSNPTVAAQPAQPFNSALQPDPSQKSGKPESPCMAPRVSAIKEQGFSEAVAARIQAPHRRSTRSVYETKWAIFPMVHH